MSTQESNEVLLQGTSDWKDWFNTFRSKAKAVHLWDQLNPDNKNPIPLLTEPMEPDISRYRSGVTRSQTAQADESAGGGGSSGGRPATEISDLTTDQFTKYKFEMSLYGERLKKYELQATRIESLTSWVRKTVNKSTRNLCCDSDQELRTWIVNLQQTMQKPKAQRLVDAHRRYQKAVAVIYKPPRNLETWLQEWVNAMGEAKAEELPIVSTAWGWSSDFFQALQIILPTWVTVNKRIYEQQIQDDTLTFQKLANDLRLEISHNPLAKRQNTSKGAFAAKFDGKESSEAGGSKEKSEQKNAGQKRGRTDSRAGGCPVCERKGCRLEKCYYAFPNLAPEDWTPKERFKKVATTNLKKKEVSEKVDEVRSKKAKGVKGEKTDGSD